MANSFSFVDIATCRMAEAYGICMGRTKRERSFTEVYMYDGSFFAWERDINTYSLLNRGGEMIDVSEIDRYLQ